MVQNAHNVGITLDQARALVALERAGTFAGAAATLRRGHTSVLYLLRGMEESLGFPVLDRGGYRTQLTERGRRVLAACRQLLDAESALSNVVHELRAGWEPTLTVVFDGIVPAPPLLRAVGELLRHEVPTRIDVRAEFLAGVEAAFESAPADLMIAVLPPRRTDVTSVPLPPVPASLVVHRDHPLARGRHDERELHQHLLLTVRGSDPRLQLPTAGIEAHSTVTLHDFGSKRDAILAGLGYGWLPDAMVTRELATKRLRRVRWTRSSTHTFHPRLYHRGQVGPAAQRLIAALS